MARAAVYARVSSEEQVQGYSIDAQLRACRTYAADKGWQVVGEYVDEGRSARTDNISKRPRFKEMLDEGLARHFNVILVHKLDRFSRNLRVTLDCFEKLSKVEVGFVSLSEQIDYSSPGGKLFLTMLGGLAQWYSDNLSQETKKGKRERKAQGLFNGLLPFGVAKGESGIPAPDPATHPGLLLAFEVAGQGKSDKAVAAALNLAGYRTTGNRGANPFSKDTVRGVLTNRFYLGYLPNGDGGWLRGRHAPIVDEELWQSAQEARMKRQQRRDGTTSRASVYSLTGMMKCFCCGGKIHLHRDPHGNPRGYCYNRTQGTKDCKQKGTFLSVYEEQVEEFLQRFEIPADYREKILEAYQQLQAVQDTGREDQETLELRLERLRKLYSWGDLEESEYLKERDEIQRQLKALAPVDKQGLEIDGLAEFLGDV